ncbi:DUF411 domain-containing protein [Neptunomonas japonica]|uniref:DUF411 domain-containing protein n=1 Tax=Neptunomonas japonica TaxID=417574 RepID=UPI0004230E1F|nr:DUF411 domain-containing protein [Neptunomonas japonica]
MYSKTISVLIFISTLLLTACSDSSEPFELTELTVETAQKVDNNKVFNVYKSPACGCCTSWIEYLEKQGADVDSIHPGNLSEIKSQLGVLPRYRSCHTAVSAEGYVFEGHVPVKYINQFLANKPVDAIGLAVPGMPVGSPGMEVGDRLSPYAVLLLKKDGTSSVYAQVNAFAEQY